MAATDTALIPDIFESFMADTPRVNEHYLAVGQESMQWISEVCNYDAEQQSRLGKADFAYFAAIAFPDAPFEKLRTIADWFNWVFAFDDKLDDGVFKDNRDEAFAYIEGMSQVIADPNFKVIDAMQQPWEFCLQSIWQRFEKDIHCSETSKRRWKTSMLDYFAALKCAVDFTPADSLEQTISGYMLYRRHSICVNAIFAFIEYAGDLTLPESIFEHSSVANLMRIGVELQMLANDCVSYHRERDLGCIQNLVFLLQHHGLSEQDSYDRVQVMLRELYQEWHTAMTLVPVFGENIDHQVNAYIRGIQNVARANANWRYFGKDREQVRRTRRVPLGLARTNWLPSVIPNVQKLNLYVKEAEVQADTDVDTVLNTIDVAVTV